MLEWQLPFTDCLLDARRYDKCLHILSHLIPSLTQFPDEETEVQRKLSHLLKVTAVRKRIQNQTQAHLIPKPFFLTILYFCFSGKGWYDSHWIHKMKTGRCAVIGVKSAPHPSGQRLAWPVSQFPPWLMHSLWWTENLGVFQSFYLAFHFQK